MIQEGDDLKVGEDEINRTKLEYMALAYSGQCDMIQEGDDLKVGEDGINRVEKTKPLGQLLMAACPGNQSNG